MIRFDQFEADLNSGELRKSGRKIRLQHQPFELLRILLQHPGEVVSREQIERQLWPDCGSVVDFDHSVNTALKKLRQALEDSASSPRFIETVPRRGYRFIARVCSSGDVLETRGVEQPARTKPRQNVRSVILVVITLAIVVAGVLSLEPRQRHDLRIVGYKQLTTDGQRKAEWAIVTAGSRVYYADRNTAQVFDVSVLGGDVRQSGIPIQGFPLDFSAKNQELLLAEWTGETAPYAGHDERPIWIVRLPTGAARRAGDLRATDAVWTRDGKYITYINGRNIALADAEGKRISSIATTNAAALSPTWKPDGSSLRFSVRGSDTPAAWSVWEVKSDGADLHVAVPSIADAEFFEPVIGRWLPDGGWFLFVAGSGAARGIRALAAKDVRANAPLHLTSGTVEFSGLAVGPDGTRIYAVGGQRRGELLRYDVRNRQLVPFAPGVAGDCVEVSPDGKAIAYVDYSDRTLWRAQVDGSHKVQLSANMVTFLPRWSPDGKRLLFMGRAPGQHWKAYVMPADGGNPTRVIEGPGPEADPNWSPDGSKIVFSPFPTDVGPDRRGVHVLDLKTGQVSKIPGSEQFMSPRWSGDGRYIAALGSHGLHLFDLAARRWKLVSRLPATYPNWSRNSRYVQVRIRVEPQKTHAIFRVYIPSGKEEQICSLARINLGGTLGTWAGVTPTGDPIVLRDLKSEDIYELHLAH